jgi:hypothetical protein
MNLRGLGHGPLEGLDDKSGLRAPPITGAPWPAQTCTMCSTS